MSKGRQYADAVRDAVKKQGQDLSDLQHTRLVLAYESGKFDERDRCAVLIETTVNEMAKRGLPAHSVKALRSLHAMVAVPTEVTGG